MAFGVWCCNPSGRGVMRGGLRSGAVPPCVFPPASRRTCWLLSYTWRWVARVCLYVFVASLDGADAFYNRHDMITHVNYVRSFAESGIWSSLHSSAFWGTGMDTASYTYAGFYPALWHSLVAMTISLTGAEVMVAINATNALVAGVVFPLAICAFIRALFPSNRRVLLCGAFVAPACTGFSVGPFPQGPSLP